MAAVSRDQTRNTMTLMPSLMSQKLIDAYGIKLGAELVRANMGRCRIEAVTSNYRSLEGGRSTFVILNETHHWINGQPGRPDVRDGRQQHGQDGVSVPGDHERVPARHVQRDRVQLPLLLAGLGGLVAGGAVAMAAVRGLDRAELAMLALGSPGSGVNEG